jgi:hypothetical protein
MVRVAEIDVERFSGESFRVTVREGVRATTHTVGASAQDVARYGGGASAEDLIAESFRFLLEREPAESILARFDLPVIERYFPEYAREIGERLG